MDWVNQNNKINNKFKFQLFGRNVSNLEKCYNNINLYDPNQTGLMSEHAFNLFLNSFGVFLSTQQLRTIKEKFSKDGRICYVDFLENVRNDITQKRIATIDHSFEELSENSVICLEGVIKKFDAKRHPECRCLTKQSDKIKHQFEQAIRKRSSDGKTLTYEEFKQYYLDVNACVPIEREEFFVDILIHSFKLLDDRVTIDRLKEMEVTVFEKTRQKTYIKKDEGEKGKGSFRFFDMEDKGIVDYGRFVQTLQRLACKFTDKEMKVLYQKHAGSDGILTYEEMCGLLFDMGSGVKDNKNPVYEGAKTHQGITTTPGMTKKQ